MSHTVKHLNSSSTFTREPIHLNTIQQPRQWHQDVDSAIEAFHRTLPHYAKTPVHSLPDVAAALGLRHVFLKDESSRLGLPSFKILGASWAIQRSVCEYLEMGRETGLEELKRALQGQGVRMVTCTDGNWGRACARMAKYLGIKIKIFVPFFLNEYVQNLLRSEGAEVVLLKKGSYDDSIAAVRKEAQETNALMVMDTSWDTFTACPQWVTDGYSTMLAETDRQVALATGGNRASIAFVSVGVGSWAHSVIPHYMSQSPSNKVVTVEPVAAPSFKESLHCGQITPIETGETIMNGMNCGTTSLIAWPEMRDGVFAGVVVDDLESHRDVVYLQGKGVDAGPCGAATLAALRKFCEGVDIGERKDVVVVLFSTEGNREYEIPE